ncbi:hypothetical protein ZWY2020_029623 [Hordeum vulgare]|nr:hypothetical protein ZWY2020_029623 [Hordeum vulgare]
MDASLQTARKMPDKMFGIFFEEINHARAGGLWAELVSNRGFSYAQVHVNQERLRRKISDGETDAATMTLSKSMAGEEEKKKERYMGEEEKKAACNSWAGWRVHPFAPSPAAASPKGGHR